MVYQEEHYSEPDLSQPKDVGSYRPPVLKIDIAEVPTVLDELHRMHRDDLGQSLARIAFMHELVVDGTDEEPHPIILDAQPALLIHDADETVRNHPEAIADEDIWKLYTHGNHVNMHTGGIVEAEADDDMRLAA